MHNNIFNLECIRLSNDIFLHNPLPLFAYNVEEQARISTLKY